MLLMGEPDRVRKLAHQAEANIVADLGLVLNEIVIQANGLWEMLENDRGAKLVDREVEGPKHPPMLEELQQAKLALGRPLKDHPLLVAGLCLDQVDTYPAERVRDRHVLGEEVLVSRALVEHRLEFGVTDPAAGLRRPDPDLFQGTRDRLCHGPVKRPARPLREPGAVPPGERGEDTGTVRLVAKTNVEARVPLELALKIWS
jgi:hypothetical protein